MLLRERARGQAHARTCVRACTRTLTWVINFSGCGLLAHFDEERAKSNS